MSGYQPKTPLGCDEVEPRRHFQVDVPPIADRRGYLECFFDPIGDAEVFEPV